MLTNNSEGRKKFLDFPFIFTSHRNLMLDLIKAVEDYFNSQLIPCALPLNVQYFQDEADAIKVSMQIQAGQSTPHWIHGELLTGGSVDRTILSAYLNLTNDSPNFVIELNRISPTMMFLFLDLPPRKDLVLCPGDLKTFYEDTQLEKHRQDIGKIPEVKPYYPSSLYRRAAWPPTAIMVSIRTPDDGGEERMEQIIRDHLHPVSKQVLGIWLEHRALAMIKPEEAERADMQKRDEVSRSRTIGIDLGSNLQVVFGSEVANRVREAMREYFCL